MTMQTSYSPKPKIFGKGYGKHLAHNYGLVKQTIKTTFMLIVNGIAPCVWYEKPHFEIIDLYYKLRGFRYGTDNPKRCDKCGSNLIAPEPIVNNVSKTEEPQKSDVIVNNLPMTVGEFEHPEDHLCGQKGIDHK